MKTLGLEFFINLNTEYSFDITKAFYLNLEPNDLPLGTWIDVCSISLRLVIDDFVSLLKLRFAKDVRVINICGASLRLVVDDFVSLFKLRFVKGVKVNNIRGEMEKI